MEEEKTHCNEKGLWEERILHGMARKALRSYDVFELQVPREDTIGESSRLLPQSINKLGFWWSSKAETQHGLLFQAAFAVGPICPTRMAW